MKFCILRKNRVADEDDTQDYYYMKKIVIRGKGNAEVLLKKLEKRR